MHVCEKNVYLLWSFYEIPHMSQEQTPKPYEFLFICYLAYQSVCHNCIWFCQFSYGLFSPLVYQFAANLGIVCDVNLEGFARIKRTQARRWQSHLFATIVWPSMDRCWFRCFDRFWTKSVCLVAYEIVSDVYLEGQSKIRTVKYIAEGKGLLLEVPSGCQTQPKIWMIFLVLFAFWLTLMSDKKCKNLHGNGGISAPIVVLVFRKFSIHRDRSLSGVCGSLIHLVNLSIPNNNDLGIRAPLKSFSLRLLSFILQA